MLVLAAWSLFTMPERSSRWFRIYGSCVTRRIGLPTSSRRLTHYERIGAPHVS
jgi:hypothetical protein